MIKVLLEVEAGSYVKNLHNERTLEYTGTRKVCRPYPFPYGFIIGTKTDDGDCVDCYVITKNMLKAGMIIECEPIGLLEMEEDGKSDHKVLAALPGQAVELDQTIYEVLQEFICAIFAEYPEACIKLGKILPNREADAYIRKYQTRP